MCLQVETPAGAADGLDKAVTESIRELTKLRGQVEFVGPDSLPNDGKVIDDQREIDV